MKYADVEGERREAQRGLSGKCAYCGDAMIAKCGDYRVRHWAHTAIRTCDPWREPETEWHRAWKNHFPEAWQEIIHHSKDGEKHIADVKSESGVVLEFQHSHLRREERESREMFYQKMVWVVDGLRRVRDRSRFFALLTGASIVKAKPLTFSLPSNDGALLRDWVGSRKPVFFDFGDNPVFLNFLDTPPALWRFWNRFSTPVLYRLDPRSPKGEAHLSPVLKTSFPDTYLKGLPLKGMDYSAELARAFRASRYLIQQAPRSRGLIGFDLYMARKQRARARVRF
jgi:competence protein CoiA